MLTTVVEPPTLRTGPLTKLRIGDVFRLEWRPVCVIGKKMVRTNDADRGERMLAAVCLSAHDPFSRRTYRIDYVRARWWVTVLWSDVALAYLLANRARTILLRERQARANHCLPFLFESLLADLTRFSLKLETAAMRSATRFADKPESFWRDLEQRKAVRD